MWQNITERVLLNEAFWVERQREVQVDTIEKVRL